MDFDRVREIISENISLMERKNRDYSNDSLVWTGTPGVATRLVDKVVRLKNLTSKPAGQINFEPIIDTLNDIINYGLIGRLLEEGGLSPTTRMVYLAGPIDDVGTSEAMNWRTCLASCLQQHNISCFNPVKAYFIASVPPVAEKIVAIDRFVISQCDVVVAYLAGEGRAFGTIREIEYARSIGKRVIVVADSLTSAFSYDVEVVSDLETVTQRLTGEM